MMWVKSKHISTEDLAALSSGELGRVSTYLAQRHLEGCWVCAGKLDAMRHAASQLAGYARQLSQPARGGTRDRLLRDLMAQESMLARATTVRGISFWSVRLALPLAVVVAITATWWMRSTPVLAADALLRASGEKDAAWRRDGGIKRVVAVEREDAVGVNVQRLEVVEWSLRGHGCVRSYKVVSPANRRGLESMPKPGRLPEAGTERRTEDMAQAVPQLAPERIWSALPASSEFVGLVGDAKSLQVSAEAEEYLVRYKAVPIDKSLMENAKPRLLSATLALRRGDLHPIRQELVVESQGNASRYVFKEVSLERVSAEEALSYLAPPGPTSTSIASSKAVESPMLSPAGLGLALDAYDALDRDGVLNDYDLLLTQHPNGDVVLSGALPTKDAGRVERALSQLTSDPHLHIEIAFVAPHSARAKPMSTPVVVESSLGEGFRTAYQRESGLSGVALEESSTDVATNLLDASSDARTQMAAVMRITALLGQQQSAGITSPQRRQYALIVQRHIVPLQHDLCILHTQLSGAFPRSQNMASAEATSSRPMGSVYELNEAVTLIDQAVEQSLVASPEMELPVLQPYVLRTLGQAQRWVGSLGSGGAP